MNKKLKEVALHDKDTGSSEALIAFLTDKIENLSAHMKKFENHASRHCLIDLDAPTLLRAEH